jgi:hypothetical protein
MRTKVLSENLTLVDHTRDLGVDGKITLKCTVMKHNMRVWTEFCLRIGASGRLL